MTELVSQSKRPHIYDIIPLMDILWDHLDDARDDVTLYKSVRHAAAGAIILKKILHSPIIQSCTGLP